MGGSENKVLKFPGAAHRTATGRLLIPGRLTEARLAACFTQTELAARVGVSRQAISSYESGEKSPEPLVLHRLAAELSQPVNFFTKTEHLAFGRKSANFFRKKGADTKRRNQACEVYSRWLSSSVYAFDHVANFPKVDLPSYEPEGAKAEAYSAEEIERHAESTRRHFGLGLGPISNMIRLLETKGIFICRLELPKTSIEAFSFWSGDRPFIFLASDKKSAVRRRFDVAHELAHLCLHKWVGEEELEDPARLKQIEAEADHFAGAFLLPRKSFPNEIYSARVEALVNLKPRWKVAIQAMIYRCKELGLFDDAQIVNMYKQISYKKWRTVEPLDDGPAAISFEEPLLLRRIAELVFASGRYRVDEMKADIALSDSTLEQFFGLPIGSLDVEQPDNWQPSLK